MAGIQGAKRKFVWDGPGVQALQAMRTRCLVYRSKRKEEKEKKKERELN